MQKPLKYNKKGEVLPPNRSVGGRGVSTENGETYAGEVAKAISDRNEANPVWTPETEIINEMPDWFKKRYHKRVENQE
jgi:hypothetical protein